MKQGNEPMQMWTDAGTGEPVRFLLISLANLILR